MALCACQCGNPVSGKHYWKNGKKYISKYIHNHHRVGLTHWQPRGPDAYNWKGGKSKDKSGYILIQMPDHPAANGWGYVREHRLVYEKHYRCCLLPWAVIHHLNKIKTDNRIENLVCYPTNSSHHKCGHPMDRDKLGRFVSLSD